MPADRAHIDVEQEAVRPTQGRTPPGPREEAAPPAPAAVASPASPPALAAPPRAGRGFDAARAATMLGLQQTLGNQAVQRLLQRAARPSAPATTAVAASRAPAGLPTIQRDGYAPEPEADAAAGDGYAPEPDAAAGAAIAPAPGADAAAGAAIAPAAAALAPAPAVAPAAAAASMPAGPASHLLKVGALYATEQTKQRDDVGRNLRAFAGLVQKLYAIKSTLEKKTTPDQDRARLEQCKRYLSQRVLAFRAGPFDLRPRRAQIMPLGYEDTLAAVTSLYDEVYRFTQLQDIVLSPEGRLDPAAQASRLVQYDTGEAQERTKVTLEGGILKRNNPPLNEPVDTSASATFFSGEGFEIFVAGPEGDIHMASHKIGKYHHSSLLAGGAVSMGGEMKVSGGTIKYVSNKSGHYVPSADHFKRFLRQIQGQGVSLDFPVGGFEDVPEGKTAAQWLGGSPEERGGAPPITFGA